VTLDKRRASDDVVDDDNVVCVCVCVSMWWWPSALKVDLRLLRGHGSALIIFCQQYARCFTLFY